MIFPRVLRRFDLKSPGWIFRAEEMRGVRRDTSACAVVVSHLGDQQSFQNYLERIAPITPPTIAAPTALAFELFRLFDGREEPDEGVRFTATGAL